MNRWLLLFLILFTGSLNAAIDEATAQALGQKIWQNEAHGRVDQLTHWNKGEQFASLGIGHFIWYPGNQSGPFSESFPDWLRFAIEQGSRPPTWLAENPDQPCPWVDREDFEADMSGPKLTELREWLASTVALQARFIAQRFEAAKPKIIAAAPPHQQATVAQRLKVLTAEPDGLYALVDYTNFKGEGINPEERYQGQGWGVLQVLLAMPGEPDQASARTFAAAADQLLSQRVALAPAERQESRWLSGWRARLQTYPVPEKPAVAPLSRTMRAPITVETVDNAIMSPLFWIISATLFGGLLSATAAGGILLVPEPIRTRLLPSLLSFAIGALLGAAFLGLLPHALEQPLVKPMQITATLLGGILLFFLLEKLVLWRHCHTESCEAHNPDEASIRPSHSASGALILLGDSTHNFLDGVLIGSAFLTDIRLGILTTIAVTAHEIPQEIGDFTILLHSGFSRMRALVLNLLVSLTTVAGGLLAYYAFNEVRGVLPYLMALAAASFIYVAVADLIPNLHKRMGLGETLRQLLLISAGISIIALAHRSLS